MQSHPLTQKINRVSRSPISFIIIFFLLTSVLSFLVLSDQNIGLTNNKTWRLAAENKWPEVGTRSPVPTLIAYSWQLLFGAGVISSYFFLVLLYGCALCFIYLSARHFFGKQSIALLTLYFTLLSPYLTWSIFVGRDVAQDLFGVSLLLYFVAKIIRGKNQHTWLGVALTGALATLIREQNLVIVLAFISYFILFRIIPLKQTMLISGLFAICLLPLFIFNYQGTGNWVLSTRLGMNLYYGNHVAYMIGHPNFDIDVFLGPHTEARLKNSEGDDLNNKTQDQLLREWAYQDIKSDPAGFLYRIVTKTLWWAGPVRIPATDTNAFLDPISETVVLRNIGRLEKDLAYILHRVFIIIFICVYLLNNYSQWQTSLLLILPLLATLPVVALTFPDTRFRLAYDPATYMMAASGTIQTINYVFSKFNSKS